MRVSDNTAISMPMRNLLSILAAVAVGVWAYIGVIERINSIENDNVLIKKDLDQAVEFYLQIIYLHLEEKLYFPANNPRSF